MYTQAFTEAALHSDNVPYVTASFKSPEGIKQPAIVLYKKFDEKKAAYSGRFDIKTGKVSSLLETMCHNFAHLVFAG